MSGWMLLALVPVGLFAGAVNTVAGGGSFVTVGALVWFGVPATVANATNRVGVVAQSLAAAGRFSSEGVDGGPQPWQQIGVTASGAVLGAILSLVLDEAAFERALGAAMVVVLALALVRPGRFTEPAPASPWRWPALFAAGAYGGFVQAGVGILLVPCLVMLGGLDPVRANARKVLLVGLFTVPALGLYVWAGLVDWAAGLVLAASSAVGGVIGARLTVGVGPRLVWGALVAVVLATAARLWW